MNLHVRLVGLLAVYLTLLPRCPGNSEKVHSWRVFTRQWLKIVMEEPVLPCPLQNCTLVGEMEVKLRENKMEVLVLVGEVREGICQEAEAV